MARTNSIAVIALLADEYDGSTSLSPHIDTANMMVSQLAANDSESLMSSVALEIVERWLAAHFYQQADPGYNSRNTSGASGSFNGATGQGLAGTRFGMQAMRIDATNYLAKRDKEASEGARHRVQFFVPTTEPATSYDDV